MFRARPGCMILWHVEHFCGSFPSLSLSFSLCHSKPFPASLPSLSYTCTVATAEQHIPAGMQSVDKDKVKKVVYDISKDSAHFQNEQRKQVCTFTWCPEPRVTHQ